MIERSFDNEIQYSFEDEDDANEAGLNSLKHHENSRPFEKRFQSNVSAFVNEFVLEGNLFREDDIYNG